MKMSKKKINAIMLSLNEMSITNGNVNGVFDLNDETDKEIPNDMIATMLIAREALLLTFPFCTKYSFTHFYKLAFSP